MADFTLVALKDEIVNDPNAIGYKNSAVPTDWKGDQAIADLINDPVNGATIRRNSVMPVSIKQAVDEPDFGGLGLSGASGGRDQAPAPLGGVLATGRGVDHDQVGGPRQPDGQIAGELGRGVRARVGGDDLQQLRPSVVGCSRLGWRGQPPDGRDAEQDHRAEDPG